MWKVMIVPWPLYFFFKTLKTWLPIFDLIGEEVRSCQPTIITSKKPNRLKQEQLFLDSLREGHRTENRIIWNAQLTPQKPNCCPQDWRDRCQIQSLRYRCRRRHGENTTGTEKMELTLTQCWRGPVGTSQSWGLHVEAWKDLVGMETVWISLCPEQRSSRVQNRVESRGTEIQFTMKKAGFRSTRSNVHAFFGATWVLSMGRFNQPQTENRIFRLWLKNCSWGMGNSVF